MDDKYEKCITQWDEVFSRKVSDVPSKATSGNEQLDKGIQWLCEGTKKILDFGCGNGTMLLLCALHGTEYNVGIDLSEKAVEAGEKRAEHMNRGQFKFYKGGTGELKNIEGEAFDGAVLSNIIDNLYPEDAEIVIEETARVLRHGGKLLVKVNPYLNEKDIKENNIKVLKDNMLDDGLLLLNNTKEQWEELFKDKFEVSHYEEIFYPEYQQYNRMFWLTKK